MKTFKTTTGATITAADRAAAAALAAQYGMGDIVGAAAPIKKARKAALRPIGVWDDLTQGWVVRPTTDYASVAAALDTANNGGGHPVLVAVTAAGRFVAPTRAEMAQL